MNCPYCGTSKFRTSRLRLEDVPRLALLQLPVRCRSCRERSYSTVSIFLETLKAQRLREEEALAREEADPDKLT